jgi:hypothetical protein
MKWKRPSLKTVLIVAIAITTVVFFRSGIYAGVSPTLQLTSYVAKTEFEMGERVNIVVSLRNIGLWTVKIRSGWHQFDFVIYDEAGNDVFQSYNPFPGEFNEEVLMPFQVVTLTIPWNQKTYVDGEFVQVPKGRYTIMISIMLTYQNGKEYTLTVQPIAITIE